MKKSLMIPVLVILLSQFVSAQNPQWKVNSGLPGGGIIGRIAIEYDSATNNNIVWLGTSNGLAKFDGETWTVYDSVAIGFHLIPSTIAIDKNNNKWLGSNKGVYMFDGVNWTNYNTTNSGIGFNFILDISVDDKNVKWFGTGLGLSRFDGSWKNYSMSNSGLPFVGVFKVTTINNEKWLGHNNSGLARLLETETDTVWSHFTSSNSGLAYNDVRGIKIDSSGLVWIAMWRGGVNVYNPTDNLWGLFFPGGVSTCLIIDKKNNKWMGTPGGGLFKLSHDSIITNFRPENSPMPSYSVHDLALDSNGNLWIANGGALVIYNEDGIVNINNPENLVIPQIFKLYQNYPNPFNPSTTISFDIPQTALVKLTVYDALGRVVATLVNENLTAGVYQYQFSIYNYQLSSGVYFYRLNAGEFSETKRMVLIK